MLRLKLYSGAPKRDPAQQQGYIGAMDFSISSYLQYCVQTLGVHRFLDPQIRELGTNVEENKNLATQADFMIVHPSALSGDEKQLLEKMLNAIKVTNYYLALPSQEDSLDGSLQKIFERFSGSRALILGRCSFDLVFLGQDFDKYFGQVVGRDKTRFVCTYSLKELLDDRNPEELLIRKRATWEHLKKLMQES